MKTKQIYEQRIVVYIDILGFKNFVDNSDSDNNFIKIGNTQKILDAFAILQEEKFDFEGKKVNLFSDSLIISYPLNENALTFLLMDLQKLSWELLQIDVLVRGGITIGNLYHKNDIVFGKALNDAHFLESELAIYPRIILTNETYTEYMDSFTNMNNTIKSLLSKDIDGFYYFNMLLAAKEFENEDTYLEFLKKVEDLITINIDKNEIKLSQKYTWLQNKLYEVDVK